MRRLFLVAVSAAISLVCVPLAEAQVLEKLMSDAWGGTYETPDPSHIAKAEGLFLKMFKGDVGASVRGEWEALGFMLEAISLPNGTAYYVRERPYQRRGRGLYVIRPQDGQPVVLQAPHKSNDLETDVIAARMMEEGGLQGGGLEHGLAQPDRSRSREQRLLQRLHPRVRARVQRGAWIGRLVGDGALGVVGECSLADPDARLALQAEPEPPPSHPQADPQGHELAGV
jgi:hypothetical protein